MAVKINRHPQPKKVVGDALPSEPVPEKQAALDAKGPGDEPEASIPVGDAIPPLNDAIFGPAPLARGEDPEIYNRMLSAVKESVGPKDIIEEFLIRDIVYLVLEVQSLRRIKANLPVVARVDGLRKILSDLEPMLNSVELAERWVQKEPAAVAQVKKLLAKAGLSEETIADEAFMSRLDEIERVDRMIAQAEARRILALREIHRHREALAEQLEIALEDFRRGQIDYVPAPANLPNGQ